MLQLNKKPIIIIGASRYTKVVIDIIESIKEYYIIGIIDTNKSCNKKSIFQYKILGTVNDLSELRMKLNCNDTIIAVEDNFERKSLLKKIKRIDNNFKYITIIHPLAIVGEKVKIGIGTVINKNVVINDYSVIGKFSILNSKAYIDYGAVLNDFSEVNAISIRKNTRIGFSELVKKNIEGLSVDYRAPRKIEKSISFNKNYFYHVVKLSKYVKETKINKKLTIITDKSRWDSLLNTIGGYDFYHTYDYHMLSKAENKKAILLKYEENEVTIAIPLLVREVPNTKYLDATSVYGYAGPINKGITDDFDNTNFKNALTEYFKKNKYVSVFSRLNPFMDKQCNILNAIGSVTQQGKIVNIDLTLDLEVQRSLFRSRLKTHINKSRRLCTVRTANTKEDIQAYIAIYHENMDRVHAKKLYYFDDAYFQSLLKSDKFKSNVLLAIDNESGKIIAGSMFIGTNGIVQYHLSGTKNEFLHLTPTKLLIDEMRIMATNKGYKFFNLGGGLGGRDDDSLFDFKSSFSKDFKEFKLWKLIVNQNAYDDLVTKKGITNESDFFPLYRALDDIDICHDK